MNVSLRDELLAMKERDLRTRARLAEDGSLYDGYHPEMEAVHRENAARLSQIIDEHGWPGPGLVGEDGAVPPLSKEVLARREREYHAWLKRVGWRS